MRFFKKMLFEKENNRINETQLEKTAVDKIVKKFIKISDFNKIGKNKKQKGGWLCPAM